MSLSNSVKKIFHGSEISSGISNYSLREEQVNMSLAISDLIELEGISVLEAGTGVGKSLAYLIPAVLSGQKTVISTATITLQDQLINKDIPTVEKILKRKVDAAVLKGRSNYICLRKWNEWGSSIAPELQKWVSAGNGDLSITPVKQKVEVKRKISCDSFECLGSMCSEVSNCFYYKARNTAMQSSLLIVNHHLLLCGITSGDLIPDSWLLIVDEAHKLDGAASSSMGYSLSEPLLNGVFDAVSLGNIPIEKKKELLDSTRLLAAEISNLSQFADKNGEVIIDDIQNSLQIFVDDITSLRNNFSEIDDLAGANQILVNLQKTVNSMLQINPVNWCCFVESSGRFSTLRCVPVHPGNLLRENLYSSFPSVLLTSATLSTGKSFSYCDTRLGLPPEADRRVFLSPFNYKTQAILVIPEDLPAHSDHIAIAEYAWGAAKQSASILNGRTMVLFTSYRNMELCAKAAGKNPLEDIPLFIQGKMNRTTILDKFRANPKAIILGTASFWEGVDLPGDLLHSIIIDRIPFPSPAHPLIKARMQLIEESGSSSFAKLMLPEAAIRLKQGTGRLIRSGTDKGVVFLLDRRIKKSSYSSMLLASIPPFLRGTSENAFDFLRKIVDGT